MVVGEREQREAKRRFVIDALSRIGRLGGDVPVDEVVNAPPALGYRNKIELTFGRGDSAGRFVGYHRAGSPGELVDVERCPVAEPRLQPLLDAVRSFFLVGPGSSDPAVDDPREPLRLVLRSSGARDERLVAFRGLPGPFSSLAAFAELAAQIDPGLVGVVRLLAAPGRRGGSRVETIAGRAWIEDEILGTVFRVPAATFLQVHPAAANALGEHVLAGAGAPRRVIELYGGVGVLGLALARNGAHVAIVEADPLAVACGEEAARSCGLTTVAFERADVLLALRGRSGDSPDLLIADPPRTGLGKGVAERVAALKAARIAMVSCDPATLARDLAALVAFGYEVSRVTPFDFFPQTAHVEAVAWLTRST